jgi:hypothetical protein
MRRKRTLKVTKQQSEVREQNTVAQISGRVRLSEDGIARKRPN